MKTINNKYLLWYNKIIERAKCRVLSEEIYTERHHIIPRSLGGADTEDNLVVLTLREHLIVHMLLPRFLVEPDKMWCALWYMMKMNNCKRSSRIYEQARTEYINFLRDPIRSAEHRTKISASNKGKPKPESFRAKISATNRTRPWTPETRAKLSASHKGKKLSPEHCAKISASNTGKVPSAETRAKISASNKGKSRSVETIAKMRIASTGRVFSAETKAKLSAMRRGRKLSPYHCARISEAKKGKPRSAETKAKLSAAVKLLWANKKAAAAAAAQLKPI